MLLPGILAQAYVWEKATKPLAAITMLAEA
jgi:hypothetical protein